MTTETDPGVSTTLDANWYETFFDEHWLVISSQTHSQERSAAEAEFLIAELGLESGQRVLDLPCGHGRHSIELARRGLRVVGVDLNDAPLEMARAAAREFGVQLDLRRVDMREIEFREEFDAVINMWTSFGYFDPHVVKMAERYPKVHFAHCGGLWTQGKHPKNAGSYFGYIDECQYLNGVVAGHLTKGKKLGFTLGEIRQMIAAEESDADRDALTLSREKCLEQIELLERQKTEIEEGLSELNRIFTSLSGTLGGERRIGGGLCM